MLRDAPLEDLAREGPPLMSEGTRRMREGEVDVRPGFDGEYGVVRVFTDAERKKLVAAS